MSRRRNGASRALIVKALAGGKTAFRLFERVAADPFRAVFATAGVVSTCSSRAPPDSAELRAERQMANDGWGCGARGGALWSAPAGSPAHWGVAKW